MYRHEQDDHELTGNAKFEGYCVDLADILADLLQFRYKLQLVADNKYGAIMDDGSWSGMVGQLTRKVGHSTLLSHD